MFKKMLLAVIVSSFCMACGVDAQEVGKYYGNGPALAAALDKTKYKKKEKRDISIEIYIDIKNEPVTKTDPTQFSGTYRSEMGNYRLDLRVSPDGSAEGSGQDELNTDADGAAAFTLKDTRVVGSYLAGTKVFANGRSERFEAVFVNRTVSTGKNVNEISSRETAFGLGFIQSNGTWSNRVFLER
jgi:hypothetical protein